MLEKVGFRLQLKLDSMTDYVKHHEQVWPEMLEALTAAGWNNYSLFLDEGDGAMFGYFETPDFDLARSKMALLEVNQRWQSLMAPYFDKLDGANPDEGFIRLRPIFYLP